MRSPNRLVGVVVGGAYLLVGILGLTMTGGVGFAASEGGVLLGVLEVNPLLSILHILIGAALLIAALSSTRAASTVNAVVGAVCLVLGLAGLFLVGSTANVLAVNVADNVVHFGSAALLLAVGLGADQGGAGTRDTSS
ncbi:hypothetical protein BH09ACT5_BH09ACT5_14540 [soil metagenome]